VDFYEKALSRYEASLERHQGQAQKMAEQDKLMNQLHLDKKRMEMTTLSKEDEMKYFRNSIMKQAEMDYDQRQKLRDEKIKTYFDTQVMKYLIQHNSQSMEASGLRSTVDQDTIELTRQFCSLQIELDH